MFTWYESGVNDILSFEEFEKKALKFLIAGKEYPYEEIIKDTLVVNQDRFNGNNTWGKISNIWIEIFQNELEDSNLIEINNSNTHFKLVSSQSLHLLNHRMFIRTKTDPIDNKLPEVYYPSGVSILNLPNSEIERIKNFQNISPRVRNIWSHYMKVLRAKDYDGLRLMRKVVDQCFEIKDLKDSDIDKILSGLGISEDFRS